RAWLDAVRDGTAHVRELPNVDSNRIALVGFSLGGYLSLALATEDGHRLAGVVSCFGGMPSDAADRVKIPLRCWPSTERRTRSCPFRRHTLWALCRRRRTWESNCTFFEMQVTCSGGRPARFSSSNPCMGTC